MQIPLPASIKIKDKEFKTEDLTDKSKKIIADLIALDKVIFESQVKLRSYELAKEALQGMLEAENTNTSLN